MRTVANVANNVLNKKSDTLVIGPTGCGKTSMMSRSARILSKHSQKTLILLHRRTLFNQMVGIKGRDNPKEAMGEVEWWTNMRPGQIAPEEMGGIDQNSDIVVGMVETVANRLDLLDDYGVIKIDETHHASETGATREEQDAYQKVLDALPEAKLVAYTATDKRGDGDKLNPRLENAIREVISRDEAREEGRIRDIETVFGRVKLANGKTPKEVAEEQLEGRIENATASSLIKRLRNDNFYYEAAKDWERLADKEPMIVFMDSVKEVDQMVKCYESEYGAGTAVGIHGGNKESNEKSLKKYATGEAGILVACKMIGEGFDVPATAVVSLFNASMTETEHRQAGGRCARTSPGILKGKLIDYGTASIINGRIEDQHDLANVEALGSARLTVNAARAVGRAGPGELNGWSVIPGENRSLFYKRTGLGYFDLYEVDHKAQKIDRRRTQTNVSRLMRVKDDDGKGVRVDIVNLGLHVAKQIKEETQFIARGGGFNDARWSERCETMLQKWQGSMELFDAKASRSKEARARREMIIKDLEVSQRGRRGSWIVKKALSKADKPEILLKEGLDAAGAVFEIASKDENLPLGRRNELREVSCQLDLRSLSEMKPARLSKEAQLVGKLFSAIGKEGVGQKTGEIMSDLSEVLDKGVETIETQLKVKRIARKTGKQLGRV